MEIEIASCLADIKQAINEINEFLPNQKTSSSFRKIRKQNVPLNETLKL